MEGGRSDGVDREARSHAGVHHAGRTIRTILFGAVYFAMTLALSSCRQVLGLDSYGTKSVTGDAAADATGQDYAGSCDGISYKSESCRDCVDKSCCKEATACGWPSMR